MNFYIKFIICFLKLLPLHLTFLHNKIFYFNLKNLSILHFVMDVIFIDPVDDILLVARITHWLLNIGVMETDVCLFLRFSCCVDDVNAYLVVEYIIRKCMICWKIWILLWDSVTSVPTVLPTKNLYVWICHWTMNWESNSPQRCSLWFGRI